MDAVITALFLLSLGVIIYGRRRSQIQEYGIYTFRWGYAPLFMLGISYDRTTFEEMEIDTFSLGLLWAVVEFNFYTFPTQSAE